MKNFGKLLTLIALVSLLAACGSPATAPAGNDGNGTELTAAEQWAQANGVGPYTPGCRGLGSDQSRCDQRRFSGRLFELFQDRKAHRALE